MTSLFEGSRLHTYRERTNQPSMLAVATDKTFVCKVCKSARPFFGRKALGPSSKYGYQCEACFIRRNGKSAANSADMKTAPSMGR